MPSFKELKAATNVVELLDDNELMGVAQKVIAGFRIDKESIDEWLDRIEKTMEIAKQVEKEKNYPFPKASNIQYPLVTQVAIDVASRLLPEFLQNDRVVKASVIGDDPTNEKCYRAQRVSAHMSYQLLNQIEGWQTDLDRALHILPIIGTVFKKTYHTPMSKHPVSELCLPHKIVVNYNTKTLNSARRITHTIELSQNDIVERVRRGFYHDVDVHEMLYGEREQSGVGLAEKLKSSDEYEDFDSMRCVHEQHCYLDLDEDGYAEPYIVTFHEESNTILRIVMRAKSVEYNDKQEVVKIEPEHFFTVFRFFQSPDGGFYGLGLGTLLYPFNKSINTLINQLIDTGTIANSNGGIIGRGLRMKAGQMNFSFNTWSIADSAPGQSLRDNVFPWPTKEPSSVLFQLLGLLINAGKDLIYSTEALKGQGETQNVASTTVTSMIEQGMKVYNAIAKRLYSSFKEEFQKIAEINSKYLTQREYSAIIDSVDANVKSDYNLDDFDILPVADPVMASQAQRLMKAQAIMSVPGINMHEAGILFLEAMQLDKDAIVRLLPPPNPNAPPPAEDIKNLAQARFFDAQAQALGGDLSLKQEELILKGRQQSLEEQKAEVDAIAKIATAKKLEVDASNAVTKNVLTKEKMDHRAAMDGHKAARDDISLAHTAQMDKVHAAIDAAKVQADAKKATSTGDKS